MSKELAWLGNKVTQLASHSNKVERIKRSAPVYMGSRQVPGVQLCQHLPKRAWDGMWLPMFWIALKPKMNLSRTKTE